MKARLAAAAAVSAFVASFGWFGARVDAAPRPKTHTVIMDAASFSPAQLTVAVGDSVVWVNRDILAHTATTTDKKTPGFDSKVIQPGKSWKVAMKKRGEFPYTCSFHPMNGKITVK